MQHKNDDMFLCEYYNMMVCVMPAGNIVEFINVVISHLDYSISWLVLLANYRGSNHLM